MPTSLDAETRANVEREVRRRLSYVADDFELPVTAVEAVAAQALRQRLRKPSRKESPA